MFSKKKNPEEFTYEEKVERARNLHAALVNSGVKAHETPSAIFRLRELYRAIIWHDAHHFKPEKLTANTAACKDSITMAEMLNKFLHFSLSKEDGDALQALNFQEAAHLRNYLVFEKQALRYAHKIHHFLIDHKKEISVKVEVNNGRREVVIPDFYKYGDAPNAVVKVLELLKNIHKVHIPLQIIKLFNKVFDVYAGVKPSKTRPVKTSEFYAEQLKKLHAMSFASLIAEEKVKNKVVRRRRKHRVQVIETKAPVMTR